VKIQSDQNMPTCTDEVRALKDEIRGLRETVATLTAIIASAAPVRGAVGPLVSPTRVCMYDDLDSDGGDSPMQCVSAMLERERDARAHLGSDWCDSD
jgi:hypothetical protein